MGLPGTGGGAGTLGVGAGEAAEVSGVSDVALFELGKTEKRFVPLKSDGGETNGGVAGELGAPWPCKNLIKVEGSNALISHTP